MRKYRKHTLAILMIPILVMSSCFAAEDKDGDCSEIENNTNYGVISTQRNALYGNILPKDAMEMAFHHLRSHCCNDGLITKKKICSNLTKNYLESPFLFDHIFNIYMRRLDAHYAKGRTKDMMYNLSPDPAGLKWRKFITETALNPKGVPPTRIVNEYQKTWKITEKEPYVQRRIGDGKYVFHGNLTLSGINKDYTNWKLVSKYHNACELVSSMYFKVGGELSVTYQGESYSIYNHGYSNCKKEIQKRMKQEKNYVRSFIADKANIMMKEYLESVLIENFSYKRLTELSRKFSDMKKHLEEVQRAVIKLVPNCS